ncbi:MULTISPECIES: helix-turn-helix domain-containing protein [Paenibacillus]|uniref:helix-turn-helix domain-containing protein n=1 Tax=Paenibacillus TaxID=44249 RepID=UPI0009E8E965|nr:MULTISPECIES: helix-turn-helix domain-containing protein [Paenibacillus]MCW3793474.1 helix-turn-helix domain-containing protein [Paenibacillus sp. LS1]
MVEHAFGPYMKQLREQHGYSINQLAEAAGISNSQISRIENGVRGVPKPATIRKIADALSVPYTEMMKQAGYIEPGSSTELQDVPEWATYKDRRDFKKMLEDDDDLMFDGIPLDEEDKKRIKDVLTGLFWEAKQMNKRKKTDESDNRP